MKWTPQTGPNGLRMVEGRVQTMFAAGVWTMQIVFLIVAGDLPGQESTSQQPLTVAAAELLLKEKGTQLTDADLQQICTATNLQELDLSGCHQVTDRGLSGVSQLRKLKSLRLAHCHRITLKGFRAVCSLPKLESLDISSIRASLAPVYVELGRLPSLTKLEVRDIRGFTSEGLHTLKNLTYLDISNASGQIRDADLVPLSALTSLRYLNINGSRQWSANRNLTDQGLKQLEKLESLEFLGLFGYFSLTANGYNRLFENLKNLENLSRTRPSGNQNLLLEGQVPDQTSVQALATFLGYVQRKLNDFKQVLCSTW